MTALAVFTGRTYQFHMRSIQYCLYKETPYYVAQCLNVDVSTFGETREEAIANIKEAVELYFEGEENPEFTEVSEISLGEEVIHA
jgi:predicted RNase H-like HicB family nuclease